MSNTNKLKFMVGNAKLTTNIHTFSLPAGHTCPLAKACFSMANRLTGQITDGGGTLFRCFSASQEAVFPSVRKARWHNFDLLKAARSMEKMANLIQQSLPANVTLIRTHVSGDFFNEAYFLAWLNVAWNNPQITIYGYTKVLPFLVKYKRHIPTNFRFTASMGGKADDLIAKHNLKYAEVVYSPEEATAKNMQIDHDDSLAIGHNSSFALLLHGTQPLGSSAGKALQQLKKRGMGGYGTMDKNKLRKTSQAKSLVIHVSLKDGQIIVPQINSGKKTFKFVPKADGLLHLTKV